MTYEEHSHDIFQFEKWSSESCVICEDSHRMWENISILLVDTWIFNEFLKTLQLNLLKRIYKVTAIYINYKSKINCNEMNHNMFIFILNSMLL